jgi:tRNA(Ile)-lysidine synthase
VTAHHLDDQAETFMMRLSRGAGVRGLAGMRRSSSVPGAELPLLRPLLGWRRSELEQICLDFGLTPADDPSNFNDQFERVRVRRALAAAGWLDSRGVATSARNLGEAELALRWSTTQAWERSVTEEGDALVFVPNDIPREIRRRILRRMIGRLANEGKRKEFRGREFDRVLSMLEQGEKTTLRGVLCSGGRIWRFIKAPPRKG